LSIPDFRFQIERTDLLHRFEKIFYLAFEFIQSQIVNLKSAIEKRVDLMQEEGFPSINEIRMRVEALEREIHLLRGIFEVGRDSLFILGTKLGFLRANREGEELLGYSWEELQKMDFLDVLALDDLSRAREVLEGGVEDQKIRFTAQIVNRGGEKIPVEFSGMARQGTWLAVLKDMREKLRAEAEGTKIRKEYGEKLRERDQYARDLQAMKDLYKEKLKEIERMREEAIFLSQIDDLTGIYNHRFFIQQLTLEVERQKRYSAPLSLLMIDIDYFKNYNDGNGHLAGDQALRAIALLIQRAVRQTDIVARYGGEEFAAILINAGWEGGREIAERVRSTVARTRFPNESSQPNGDLTVSVGLATFTPPWNVTDLIREADTALYRAKRAGRNRVEG
jgi:diguanylate cyclase (GGDEF)-like protein/PAS domain S-box-containing protein